MTETLVGSDPHADPLSGIHTAIAFGSTDWADSPDLAWVYGIVAGWNTATLNEVAARYGWTGEQKKLLRQMHRQYRAAELNEEKSRRS